MPLLASIDVGSNTLRLLIAEVKDNRLTDIYYGRKITRLGTGVGQTGRLLDKNVETSVEALKEFSSIISRHGVRSVKAVATSALREASNSDTFIKKVLDNAGIIIDVISGDKEAELTLRGIISALPESLLSFRPLLILDVGGGSTEWILYRKDNQVANRPRVEMGSIPTGVMKLASFVKTDPVSEADVKRLNDEIVLHINDIKGRIGKYISSQTMFMGTAGTFSTIASIDLGLETYSREKIHLHRLPLSRLKDMSKRLLSLPLEERKNVRGLEPERADLIIPGLQFTIKVMEFFNFDELIVSDYGLLEGVLFDIMREADGKNIS